MMPWLKAQRRAELREETREWREAAEMAMNLQGEVERLIGEYAEKGLNWDDLAEATGGLDDGRQLLSYTVVGVITARQATKGKAL